jgi:hypothetical protein
VVGFSSCDDLIELRVSSGRVPCTDHNSCGNSFDFFWLREQLSASIVYAADTPSLLFAGNVAQMHHHPAV